MEQGLPYITVRCSSVLSVDALDVFTEQVSNYMARGYEPLGAPVALDTVMVQAMVRPQVYHVKYPDFEGHFEEETHV
jgi:hypothetical protein